MYKNYIVPLNFSQGRVIFYKNENIFYNRKCFQLLTKCNG